MKTAFQPGNALTLLKTGSAFFPALIEAIDGASREFLLETYIFENDATGKQVADALCRAAQRGVTVRIVVDGFGSPAFDAALRPALEAAGAHVLVYRPEKARWRLRRYRLRRLHRKLASADGRIAFIGGINIIDDVDARQPAPPRFDYAVRLEGPLLGAIHASMRQLWTLVAWTNLPLRRLARQSLPVHAAPRGHLRAAFVVRDNVLHRRDIEDAYLEAIENARQDILLANAYFLPGRRFRRALLRAAERGIRIHILLQGRIEYFLQYYATQALYGALLSSGIRIFEYHHSFLHAKVAVIDCCWATVGSSNIDPFSLFLAREANIIIDDSEFASELRASLDAAIENGAHELRREDWERQSWLRRLVNWLAYGVVRLMVGVAGFGDKY